MPWDRAFRYWPKTGTIVSFFWVGILLVSLLGAPQSAQAQLSPGKLSRAHSDLEGLRRCNQCHELGNREVLGKCLDCHVEIKTMRTTGKGLHAGDSFGDCVDCHVEHQGQEEPLIYWDRGQNGFDHTETGFALQGRHGELDCRKCHTQSHILDPRSWRAAGKNLERTFLGLGRQCLDCHEDHHRGQLGNECLGCHDQQTWKNQPRFNHGQTAFVLDGRHLKVDCVKCHLLTQKAESSAPVHNYKPIDHATCAACHQDPHQRALGPSCAICHSTKGWLKITGGKFNHDRTRYPLRGRHAGVDCEKCHGSGVRVAGGQSLSFAACMDCHQDQHGAQARGKPAWEQCENCHDVEGFVPSRFNLTKHQETEFPLAGSHLAVPCGACHRKPRQDLKLVFDLAPKGGDCLVCHGNPHGEGWLKIGNTTTRATCRQCHNESSWQAAATAKGFDHDKTGFPLAGRHGSLACRGCHHSAAGKPGELVFKGAQRNCAGCHEDPHGGQFSSSQILAEGVIDCGHCHVAQDWYAEKFNHEVDTRFPLKGSHEQTPCRECHGAEKSASGMMIRYKPLPMNCADCHSPMVPDRKVKS